MGNSLHNILLAIKILFCKNSILQNSILQNINHLILFFPCVATYTVSHIWPLEELCLGNVYKSSFIHLSKSARSLWNFGCVNFIWDRSVSVRDSREAVPVSCFPLTVFLAAKICKGFQAFPPHASFSPLLWKKCKAFFFFLLFFFK